MNPIRIQFTYDLSDVGVPSMVPGSRLPDINDYPVVNTAQTEKNFSVSPVLPSCCCGLVQCQARELEASAATS